MRPHFPLSLLLMAALTVGATASLAAAPGRPMRADANRDGLLSKSEFVAQRVKLAMRLDSDGDGKISAAEWAARGAGAKAAAGKRDPAKAFARLDLNHDGLLDESELAAAAEKQFARFDADHDGQLTAAEQRPARRTAAAQ